MNAAGFDVKKSKDGVLDCIGILREIGTTWSSGGLTADILEGLQMRSERERLSMISQRYG